MKGAVWLQVDDIFIDNDDLTLFLTNVEGIPWNSTSFGQKEQKDNKDHSSHATGSNVNGASHSSAAWPNASVQSGSAGSGDGAVNAQHPSIISTYCPQVLLLIYSSSAACSLLGFLPCFLPFSLSKRPQVLLLIA
jgi:hypothetical protein